MYYPKRSYIKGSGPAQGKTGHAFLQLDHSTNYYVMLIPGQGFRKTPETAPSMDSRQGNPKPKPYSSFH